MAPPVELPTDTVVDLDASGTNENPGLFGTGAGSVIVMFSPSGNVSEYYYTNYCGHSRVEDADRADVLPRRQGVATRRGPGGRP